MRILLCLAVVVGLGVFSSLGWSQVARNRPVATRPSAASQSEVKSDHEIREELNAEVAKADKELNETYQRLLAKCDEEGRRKLKAAQRAWIVFRDAECELEGDSARGGTLQPILFLSCKLSMTTDRTQGLKKILAAL